MILLMVPVEHREDRQTAGLARGPAVQPPVNRGGSQIVPVQLDGASHCLGVDVGSALGHLICKHRPLSQEEAGSRGKRKHELCFACKRCCLLYCGCDNAQPSRL